MAKLPPSHRHHWELNLSEVPEHIREKYSEFLDWLRSEVQHELRRIFSYVRLISMLAVIREQIADREDAWALLSCIKFEARMKLNAFAALWLRKGYGHRARQMLEMWDELVKYTESEIREKPWIRHPHKPL